MRTTLGFMNKAVDAEPTSEDRPQPTMKNQAWALLGRMSCIDSERMVLDMRQRDCNACSYAAVWAVACYFDHLATRRIRIPDNLTR